jgi:hypothetical protein
MSSIECVQGIYRQTGGKNILIRSCRRSGGGVPSLLVECSSTLTGLCLHKTLQREQKI